MKIANLNDPTSDTFTMSTFEATFTLKPGSLSMGCADKKTWELA